MKKNYKLLLEEIEINLNKIKDRHLKEMEIEMENYRKEVMSKFNSQTDKSSKRDEQFVPLSDIKQKIKEVEKEERILKEVAKVFPRSKGLGKYGLYLYEEQKLREAIELTLKSCSEEQKAKVKKLKERIKIYLDSNPKDDCLRFLLIDINKIFSPEEADLQEKKI